MGLDKADYTNFIRSNAKGGKAIGEVFLIHGISGNVGDLSDLSTFLNEHGYDTIRVLLKYHEEDVEEKGQNYRNVNKSKNWQGWIARTSLFLLNYMNQEGSQNKEIHIIGFSMGGAITLFLDSLKEERKINIKTIITLNAPLYSTMNKKFIAAKGVSGFMNGLRKILPFIGPAKVPSPKQSDEIREKFSQSNYNPVHASDKLGDFLKYLENERLSKVTSPIFIAQSLNDNVVDPKSGKVIAKKISSKVQEYKEYGNSGHMITIDSDHEELFRDILLFYKRMIVHEKRTKVTVQSNEVEEIDQDKAA